MIISYDPQFIGFSLIEFVPVAESWDCENISFNGEETRDVHLWHTYWKG